MNVPRIVPVHYEKGGLKLENLPEEAQVAVEEDYGVCVRMLARAAGAKPASKRGNAKPQQAGLFQ